MDNPDKTFLKRKLDEAKEAFSKRAKGHEQHDATGKTPPNVGVKSSSSRVAQRGSISD